ncbi:MAG: hypothetical protein LW817_07640 [Candidatus Caenarcaniphilales bacterium]|jgi:hypothetical protein|nr:hypothetical protein [Candidatus Caenarcaniphilales bacterium]
MVIIDDPNDIAAICCLGIFLATIISLVVYIDFRSEKIFLLGLKETK